MQDNFTYQYYSGTNKLSRVSGNVDQFRYDLNGNVTTDSVYNNFSISYDHRNLITELYHIDTLTSTRQYSYATRYWYDETGNRVRKLTYRNAQIPPPQINDWGNPGNGWTLLNNEHYVRGVDGKELATYTSNNLTEWYVWASDMVGKIKGSAKYYFFKDHLGSVRAVVDNNFNLVSAVDYDMWGDKMQGRIYNGDSSKFGFTGKEEDDESYYDYFGARYYDAKVGRWGQVDPLQDKEPSKTPYHYTSDNPINKIDPYGLDDIYYKNGEEVDRRESGFWEFDWLFGDTYYVQNEAGNVGYNGNNYFEALSEATIMQFKEWDRVVANWESLQSKEGFSYRLLEALEGAPSDLDNKYMYVLKEGPSGRKLDQKRYLQKYSLYVFNNIAMNYEEAGNVIFGAAINELGINLDIANIAGHIYSIKANKRLDEFNEVQAYTIGYFNFNSNSLYFQNRSTQPYR